MSIFGLSNSFVQGFDTKNSNFCNLKKISSRLLSSGSNFLNSEYQNKVDPNIIEVFRDYVSASEYTPPNTNCGMGSKYSHMSYSVPKFHYEMKKPAVNIIGGYVGAKSQQNRGSPSICIFRDIVSQLLPDLWSESERACKEMAANFIDMQSQAEEYYGRKLRERSKNQNNLRDVILVPELPFTNKPTVTEENVIAPEVVETVSHSLDDPVIKTVPTYAAVLSSSPQTVPTETKESKMVRDNSNRNEMSGKAKSGKKNRRKRKRRQKKSSQITKNGQHSEQISTFVIEEFDFPSLCEASAPKDGTLEIANSGSKTPSQPDCEINQAEKFNLGIDEPAFSCTAKDEISSREAWEASHFTPTPSVDEVDSPVSKDFSNYCIDNGSTAAGSPVLCHNNTIAFIINGNDELSDTDSDWSCEAIDTFQDDLWESFKQNFECFQNLFDRVCPSESIPQEDGVLQDEDLVVYINHIETSDEHRFTDAERLIAVDLQDVNEKWNFAMKDVEITEKEPSKVYFAPDSQLVQVRHFDCSLEEIRSQSWEHYELDRCRFKNHIQTLEPIISPCFDAAHRQKVWEKLNMGA